MRQVKRRKEAHGSDTSMLHMFGNSGQISHDTVARSLCLQKGCIDLALANYGVGFNFVSRFNFVSGFDDNFNFYMPSAVCMTQKK